ncbi:endolytic transglycosylase MltG [Peptostreptococcus faecalis]|uniref:endolytic transglycosylase MltG n=1 Tax=Peptostreptococcus faecalis TaxID=2045015 RepID=UPI001FA90A8B|nr:endolytic transglycosylase MltG [Peptostreptococcus faecalis]
MNTNNKRIKKGKVKKKKRIRISRLILVLVVLLVIFAGAGNLYYKSASKAVNDKSTKSVLIEVPNGSSVKKVAKILKEKDLIKNKSVFISNVKGNEKAKHLKAGKYKLAQNMDNNAIIEKLIKGEVYQDGVKLTIPEGMLSTEIVNKLVSQKFGDREKFVKLYRSPKEFSSKFSFLKDSRISTLEGFLFPSTYYIKKGETEKQIFEKMLLEFQKEYDKKVKSLVEKNKLNLYDTVIMASIVEKEAVNDSDRDIVAGIFYNRLDKKMKLQSDAVLQYGLPERKSRVLYSDLKVETPYNLYLHEGLPPTPIASPGIKSLIAAANPKKTDYLYFVTNVDGKNSYSTTFEEHSKNAKKYHQERNDLLKENSSEKNKTGNDENDNKEKSKEKTTN